MRESEGESRVVRDDLRPKRKDHENDVNTYTALVERFIISSRQEHLFDELNVY